MAFGTLLRRLRVAAGLSQEALAERARISAKAVASLEVGARRAPYRETVEQLLAALDPTPEERSELTALADAARARKPRPASSRQGSPSENLPMPPTRLIGRAKEVAEAAALLMNERLVTLVGPGGVGKTRAAIAVARERRSEFPGGVWFVDLAALSAATAVLPTVAAVVGIASAQASTCETIAGYLRDHRALLIFDNCEHVLDPIRQLARALLQGGGEPRILATSREPMGTEGEAIFEIPALDYPQSNGALTPETAMEYSAIELFCDRVSKRDSRFVLQADDCAAVARIVRRLDGLPLAIELAAAKVHALGITMVERRLNDRFELLSGGDRAAPSRQQALHALIAWSYDLLTPSEQRLLRRLSVFTGGWSLDAAESVCGDREVAVLPNLTSLVEKSLVVKDVRAGDVRYTLLESTRAFVREVLPADEGASFRLPHAHWVVELLRTAEERVDAEPASTRLASLFPDLENIRAALQWCDASNEFWIGSEIACRIPELFYWYGFAEEGCTWLRCFLERVKEDEHPEVTARLCAGLARLSSDANTRFDASKRAVNLAERTGDARLCASAYTRHAVALYLLGRLDEALAANDRACELLRLGTNKSNLPLAWALQHRSWMLVELRSFDDARACIEEAIQIFTLRNARREAWGLSGDLAELEFAAGRAERALEIIDEALPIAAENGDPERESVFACNRAGYLLGLGDFTEAEAAAREALTLALEAHRSERVLHALEHLAAALASRDDFKSAAMLAGFVEAGYASSGYERETTERSSHDILTEALRRAPAPGVDAFVRQGGGMTYEDAVALAGSCAG